MRTTINIKDEVIKQVIEYTGAKNMSQAVNEVLETFVREKRKQKYIRNSMHVDRCDDLGSGKCGCSGGSDDEDEDETENKDDTEGKKEDEV